MTKPASNNQTQQSINTKAARTLAVTTNTIPQMTGITPRWLLHLLPWVQIQSGTYRVNRTKVIFQDINKVRVQPMAKFIGIRHIGTAANKVGVFSFVCPNISNEEIGKFLNQEGIAVRTGHHCAQPTMQRFGVTGTVRPSLVFYNTFAEIDTLIEVLHKLFDRLQIF